MAYEPQLIDATFGPELDAATKRTCLGVRSSGTRTTTRSPRVISPTALCSANDVSLVRASCQRPASELAARIQLLEEN